MSVGLSFNRNVSFNENDKECFKTTSRFFFLIIAVHGSGQRKTVLCEFWGALSTVN